MQKSNALRSKVVAVAGAYPGIIFPIASAVQLGKVLLVDDPQGLSSISLLLFGSGTLCLYVFSEKYKAWQAIFGLLVNGSFTLAAGLLALAKGAGF